MCLLRVIIVLTQQFLQQNIIDGYDQDKDDRLDYNEFLRYMMDREKKWKINFHDLDKNKCGEYSHEQINILV